MKSAQRLLIIEDEPELREILVSLLSLLDAHIDLAGDGEEAITLLQEKTYSAILSDEKMPKKSGLEVLSWLRHRQIATPFIMHTGYGDQETVEKARQLDVFAFIEKPWTEETLLSVLGKALAGTPA